MIKGWSLLYAVSARRWTEGDYCAFVKDYERAIMVNRFGGLREIPVMSEVAATNAGLYIVAQRERMRGLVFGNERPALSLTPLAKVELDATWLEDASRAAGLDFAWMG